MYVRFDGVTCLVQVGVGGLQACAIVLSPRSLSQHPLVVKGTKCTRPGCWDQKKKHFTDHRGGIKRFQLRESDLVIVSCRAQSGVREMRQSLPLLWAISGTHLGRDREN